MALRASDPMPTFAESVKTALKELGWDRKALYARYWIRRGEGARSDSTLDNYLDEQSPHHSEPQITDYDALAAVLNEALGQERFPRLPFAPRLRGRDSNPQPTDWGTKFTRLGVGNPSQEVEAA